MTSFLPPNEENSRPIFPAEFDPEIEATLLSFDEIQAELNYRNAQTALQEMVDRLDLQPQERQGLEQELAGLSSMVDKLERSVVHIAAFGMVGRGKSSLLNALIGQPVFQAGAIHGVTQTTNQATWVINQERLPSTSQSVRKATSQVGAQIELMDTPGIDEVGGEDRELLAKTVAQQADLLLFVVSGDMTQVEFQALAQLREVGKPMILVFNKIDQYPEVDRQSIYAKIRDERVKRLLSPDEIVMASAAPLMPIGTRQADGRIVVRMVAGEPQVQDLKLKILEVLDREGKALLALNSMLFADGINEQIVERKLQIREASGDRVIWNSVMAKAIAVAVNPVTVIDILSSAAIDVALILSLSKLYGIPMTEKGAIGLLKNIGLAMGGITASELFADLGLSSLKGLLGLAVPATGGLSALPYLSVAIAQAGVAGVATYSIGHIARAYLANGATWGPDGPKAVVDQILSSLDERSILSRIREELRAKLGRQQ
ncbi:GTP-binding protein [Alkalinema pantanalense CENA528]|uniref:GTP-binding protein n=1 Tax=Alkalinema pantanalense TaxID=1620705 RepID=UPI003D6E4A0D